MSINIKNSSALAALKNLSRNKSTGPVKPAAVKPAMRPATLEDDEDEDEDDEEEEDEDEDEDEDESDEDEESENSGIQPVDESDEDEDDEDCDEDECDEEEESVVSVDEHRLVREPLIAMIQMIVKHHKAIIATLMKS